MENFNDWSLAFAYCREKDAPVTIIVHGKKWRLYPSGTARRLEKEARAGVIDGAFYEVYDTPQEVSDFAAYGETVRETTGENPVDWPDAHTVATRARNRANAQQVREWEAEKTAAIEKILSDTQTGPRRNPSGICFVEASDLCWIGK